ncbi:flagellar hook-length control protein FliK [Selenomonas massiliensis]|uniref:flagellar hook-length control protein FliK n=1 Tax=Selenomonas massiliensis TaxID=2058293 RepID=UPI000D10DD1E|nr:flagellar hook-length control protein FliK [Selenomonas massiliensis]
MNAGNLMAAATADGISAGAGAPKGRVGSAENRAQTTSGKNSFSDTFGALQKGIDAEAAKTETRDGSGSAAQRNVAQTESTALSQDTQDVTAKTPKAADEKQAEPATEKTKVLSADDAAADPIAAAALAALVNVDAAQIDTDVNEGLDAALTEILERYGLTADQLGDTKLKNAVQNLLQQVPAEGAKNSNLLLALEGQPLVPENAGVSPNAPAQQIGAQEGQVLPASTQNVDASVLRLAALDTPLSAKLGVAANTEVPVAQENMPAIAADTLPTPPTAENGENAAQRSTLNTSVLAPQPNTEVTAETIAAPLLRAQAEPVQLGTRWAAELVGNNLVTDENLDAANPLTVLAQRTMRHDTTQGDTTSQQSDAQEEQQLPTSGQQDVRMASGTVFELPSRTTETAAPQPAQPIAAQLGTTPLPTQEVEAPVQTQDAQRPQPDYEIPRQIVEQARLLRTLNDTQMVIRLHPEHLGELTLRVSVGSNGAVQASFHSDNAQVRNVIENSLVQLRQELNNQGLKVDRVGVYAGLTDGQMPQGQGQEAWQQQSSHRGETRIYGRGDADDYLDEIDTLAPAMTAEEHSGSVSADGVDYRV